jgi:hypothetical protein
MPFNAAVRPKDIERFLMHGPIAVILLDKLLIARIKTQNLSFSAFGNDTQFSKISRPESLSATLSQVIAPFL